MDEGIKWARHVDDIPDVIEDAHSRREGREIGVHTEPHVDEYFKRMVNLASASVLGRAGHHGVTRNHARLLKTAHPRGRCIRRQTHGGAQVAERNAGILA